MLVSPFKILKHVTRSIFSRMFSVSDEKLAATKKRAKKHLRLSCCRFSCISRLRNDLLRVDWDVKPRWFTHHGIKYTKWLRSLLTDNIVNSQHSVLNRHQANGCESGGRSHMWNETEIKHCRRWSAEIKQICFSFVSVLFQFHFTCAILKATHGRPQAGVRGAFAPPPLENRKRGKICIKLSCWIEFLLTVEFMKLKTPLSSTAKINAILCRCILSFKICSLY